MAISAASSTARSGCSRTTRSRPTELAAVSARPGQIREPQGPRLQTQPFKDIYLLRQAEQDKLSTYGWVDQAAGVVHLPIDEAMRIMSERNAVESVPGSPAG